MIGCGLGEGMEPALQGFLTYLTGSSQNAQLFTTVAVADTLGELTSGPLTGTFMAIGRKPGHPSDGLGFLASSVRGPLSIFYVLFKSDSLADHVCAALRMGILCKSREVKGWSIPQNAALWASYMLSRAAAMEIQCDPKSSNDAIRFSHRLGGNHSILCGRQSIRSLQRKDSKTPILYVLG